MNRVTYGRCDLCGKTRSCSETGVGNGHVRLTCHRCDPDLYLRISEEEKEAWLRDDQKSR